jgi:hypothetical protein
LPPVSTTLGKLVAKFAAGVVDTGGNLPPVSLILAANFAAGVVDTGGKFATGVSVVDTGGAP